MPINVSVSNTGDPKNEEDIMKAIRAIAVDGNWDLRILGSHTNTKFEVTLPGGPKNTEKVVHLR